jgi:large subunit ribosomal protein L23
MAKNREILISPVISEKSLINQESGIYTFIVDRLSNKKEIQTAVEDFFKVKVANIHTVKVYPHKKRTRAGMVHTKTQKKAYVQLVKGYDIESIKVS